MTSLTAPNLVATEKFGNFKNSLTKRNEMPF